MVSSGANVKAIQFQSTLSVRRATLPSLFSVDCLFISIHALRKESDIFPDTCIVRGVYFNPRSP